MASIPNPNPIIVGPPVPATGSCGSGVAEGAGVDTGADVGAGVGVGVDVVTLHLLLSQVIPDCRHSVRTHLFVVVEQVSPVGQLVESAVSQVSPQTGVVDGQVQSDSLVQLGFRHRPLTQDSPLSHGFDSEQAVLQAGGAASAKLTSAQAVVCELLSAALGILVGAVGATDTCLC